MKLLKEYINLLLIESRISDAQAKYPDVDVEELALSDPSGNYKYLDWMADQVNDLEDQEEVENAIAKFHANQQRLSKRDINAYVDLAELLTALQIIDEPSKTQKKKLMKSGGNVIYADENVTVQHIATKDASVQYGKGTKWCISMASEDHFEDYVERGMVFYFIFANEPKGDNNDKIAVAARTEELGDYDDENTGLSYEYYDAGDNIIDAFPQEYNYSAIMNAIVAHAGIKETEFDKYYRGKYDNDLTKKKQIANELLDYYAYDVLHERNDSEEAEEKIRLIISRITDPDYLAELAEHKVAAVREIIAYNQHIDMQTFKKLMYDEEQIVRLALGMHKALPIEVAKVLINDDDAVVRYTTLNAWSHYNNLPELQWDILKRYVDDNSIKVRSFIAGHKNTPPDQAIKYFLNDNFASTSLAKREDLSYDDYMTLATNDNTQAMQYELLQNDAVPDAVKEYIVINKA